MELTQTQKELVSNNINLVYKVATNMKVLKNQDAIQEGIMGLCMASIRFNEEISKFSTYATYYIKCYILTFLNYDRLIKPGRNLGKFVFTGESEYIEENCGEIDDRTDRFETMDCLYKAISKLGDTSKIIIQMYSEGLTQEQIASRLGHSQPYISRELKKILAFIKENI